MVPALGMSLLSGSFTVPCAPVAPARTKRAIDVCDSLAGHVLPSAEQEKFEIAAPYEVRLSAMAPGTKVLPAMAFFTVSADPVKYAATVCPESAPSKG